MSHRMQKNKRKLRTGYISCAEECAPIVKSFGNAVDIEAFEKMKIEDLKNVSRWKSEGGKN